VAELSLEHNINLATMTFQIVDIDQENVLSGNAAEALQLISRLASIGRPYSNKDLTQTKAAWNLHNQIGT